MRRIAVCVVPLLFVVPASLAAQVHVGMFTGTYYDDAPGGHPDFWFAIGARVGAHAIGPLNVEAEGLLVPVRLRETRDLFAWRLNLRVELLDGAVRPFLLGGAGWERWRVWTDWSEETGGVFRYERGPAMTLGAGTRIRATAPFWLRLDVRLEQAFYEAPTNTNYMGTLGVEVSIG